MSNVTVIFGSINVMKSVGEYLGLIESTSADVKKLIHQPLRSANLSMEYAYSITLPKERQLEYLKKALYNFMDATTLEVNENLISAYVGLAMCQYYLGEKDNARRSLGKIRKVQLSTAEQVKEFGKKALLFPALSLLSPFDPLGPFPLERNNARQSAFLSFKNRALAF